MLQRKTQLHRHTLQRILGAQAPRVDFGFLRGRDVTLGWERDILHADVISHKGGVMRAFEGII